MLTLMLACWMTWLRVFSERISGDYELAVRTRKEQVARQWQNQAA